MSAAGRVILPIVHKPGCAHPFVVLDCRCGANRHCTCCGWGNGQYPCECSPMLQVPAPVGGNEQP